MAQDNLWGLYGKYLWEPKLGNNMENIWVICGKYVGNIHGSKIVYGLVWVFISKWANEIKAWKFVHQQLHNFNKKLWKKKSIKKKKHSNFEWHFFLIKNKDKPSKTLYWMWATYQSSSWVCKKKQPLQNSPYDHWKPIRPTGWRKGAVRTMK